MEEMYKGMRYKLDATLTRAIEDALAARMEAGPRFCLSSRGFFLGPKHVRAQWIASTAWMHTRLKQCSM